jgi:hypothetical protein
MAPATVESLIQRNKSVLFLSDLVLPDVLSFREIAKDWQARPLFADIAKDPNAQKGAILLSTYLIVSSSPLFVECISQSPVSIFAAFPKNFWD